ncbi:MAG: acetylxylan esterase [Clostridia bacterium]|nr:acetylxylan esterase [Clostridia bacterium]
MINGDLCHEALIEKINPKLSFDKNADYQTWKRELKAKLVELSGFDLIADNACDPQFEIVSKEQKDGYQQIRFEFYSEVGERVPCYLLIPDGDKEKYPVAITQQGHSPGFHISIGEFKNEQEKAQFEHEDFAVQAVRRGFVALAIENRGMGERMATRVSRESSVLCRFASVTALALGRTLIAERVWDVMRAIDMLSYFPKCDLDKILITGHSGGGTLSYYAACLDERIKLSVPSCAFSPYKTSILDIIHCNCNYIPSSYRYFEMQDLAALIAPRRLILVNGEKDDIFPVEGVKKGFKTIQAVYKSCGIEESCSLAITPMHHYWCKDIVWDAIMDATKQMGWFV